MTKPQPSSPPRLSAIAILSCNTTANEKDNDFSIVHAKYPHCHCRNQINSTLAKAVDLMLPWVYHDTSDFHNMDEKKMNRGKKKVLEKDDDTIYDETDDDDCERQVFAFVITNCRGERLYGCATRLESWFMPTVLDGKGNVDEESCENESKFVSDTSTDANPNANINTNADAHTSGVDIGVDDDDDDDEVFVSGVASDSSFPSSSCPLLENYKSDGAFAGERKDSGGEVFILCALSPQPCSKLLAAALSRSVAATKFEYSAKNDWNGFRAMIASRISFTSSASIPAASNSKKKRRKKDKKNARDVSTLSSAQVPSPASAVSPTPVLSVDLVTERMDMFEKIVERVMLGVNISETMGLKSSFPTGLVDADPSTTDIALLVCSLSPRCLTSILGALMEEKRVVITSANIFKLSRCVLALSLLPAPMTWPHALIPLLSDKLLDVLAAPVPYLVGVPAHLARDVSFGELDQVLWVDMDSGDVFAYRAAASYCMSMINKKGDYHGQQGSSIENLGHRIPRRPRSRLEKKFAKLAHTPWREWTRDMTYSVSTAVQAFYTQLLAKSNNKRFGGDVVVATSFMIGSRMFFHKTWDEPFRGFVENFCRSQMYMTWKQGNDRVMEDRDEYGEGGLGALSSRRSSERLDVLTKRKRRKGFPLVMRRRKMENVVMGNSLNVSKNVEQHSTFTLNSGTSLKSFLGHWGNGVERWGVRANSGNLRRKRRFRRDADQVEAMTSDDYGNHTTGLNDFACSTKGKSGCTGVEFASQPSLKMRSKRRRQHSPNGRYNSKVSSSSSSCASEAALRIEDDLTFKPSYGFSAMAAFV